jgi:HSP20 family molecular chaperone IbpA
MLGFDELEEMLGRMNKNAEGFPPYNIELLDDTYLRITLAVAGYLENNLDITLEDNQLVIRGHQENNPNRRYLHRGIAARTFLKSFVLADGIKIISARLENGLLHIDLQRPEKKRRIEKITIQTESKPVLLQTPRKPCHRKS